MTKVLFISYNGATEPLIKSQGIPYLKGLARKGAKCVLMSFEKPSADAAAQAGLEKELQAGMIEWRRLRYHKSPSLPATIFDILAGIVEGIKIVLSRDIDIVHARATVPAVMAYVISRLTCKKFVYDERGLMAEEYADGGIWKRGGLLYRIVRSIEKRLLLKADAVVVLTENIKGFLSRGGYLPELPDGRKLNIHVIPCCVDLARFAPSPDDKKRLRGKIGPGLADKFIIIYTGSVGTWYMLDEMIDFYIVARSVMPQAHLMVVTHIDRDAVRAALDKRGIGPEDATVTGAEFEDMPDYLNAADAGIFFIRPVLSKRSSCPIKFAEYLACGLPVVINGGIGDTAATVEDNSAGIVVRDFSNKEYDRAAKGLAELARDGGAAGRCREAAEKFYSLDSGIAKYEDVYKSVSITKGIDP
ncbi:MAG: glycosyltransferase family 4 protein [Candidatus Omnitrophota bacterium]|jgi:glycosyltransferase involved in cell wall biosynthesis